MKTHATPLCTLPRAFSLVEVAIAIGIVTFSLVSVLGLLPIGLSSFRDATESTIESQIISQIASEAALMPFHELPGYASAGPYYFNEEGSRVESEAQASYWADVSLKPPSYPGNPASIDGDLTNLQVKITTLRNRATTKRLHNLFIARSDVKPSGQ